MKVSKRILAIVMALLMLSGTCVFAVGAVGSLQALIDESSDGDVVVMTADTTESIVITKNLTLDLGGKTLTGVPGKPAITVQNASVTITNGRVYSQFAQVDDKQMLATVVDYSPAAIYVDGGDVAIDRVRAIGSLTKVPTTDHQLPTGNAVALVNGAEAFLAKATLVGRYAVNNAVTNHAEGGMVTIEDAILIGIGGAVKDASQVSLGDTTEEVVAADRIEGFLNKPYKLEERERKVLKEVMADRVMIYTKGVDDGATITPSDCTELALVEAHEDVNNLLENNTATDCSYKYVPEYVVLEDGTLVKLTPEGDTYTAEIGVDQMSDLQIKYRLEFDMQDDVREMAENFDQYLEDLYEEALDGVEEVYAFLLEKYTKYVGIVGDILFRLDNLGSEPFGGKRFDEIDEFNELRRAILDIGGATAYNAADRDFPFGQSKMEYYYGPDAVYPADGIVGTIDRVAKLKDELEANFMPLRDQSKWADLVYWIYENYEEVIDIIDEALERIDALQEILDRDLERGIITAANLDDQRATLDKVQRITEEAKALLDKVLEDDTVALVLQKLDRNQNDIKPYVKKFIHIYNNHTSYFKPANFIDGNFAKAYAVYGIPGELDPTSHVWDEGTPVEPTCTEGGGILYTCLNNSDHTLFEPDGTDPLGHTFEEAEWVADDEQTHSRVCTRCGEETQTEEHEFDVEYTDPTCTENGYATYTCPDCGYTYTEEGQETQGHVYGEWESAGDDNHEQICEVCGDRIVEPHDWREDEDAFVAPDEDTEGLRTYVCDTCGDVKYETVEKLDHDWDEGVYTEPTCTEDGYTTYTCKLNHSHTQVVVDEGSKLGHDFDSSEWLICDDTQHMRTCDRCGDEIEYADHTFGNPVWTWSEDNSSATATFQCPDCEYTKKLTDDQIDAEVVEEETCTSDRIVNYVASVDFNGETYTDTKENITVPNTATGHEAYDGPVWSWADDYSSATATFTCKKGDDTQVLTDNDIEVTTVSEETCTADRVETYTASVEFNGETYTDTKENITVEGTATGHEEYDGPVWSWADDYSSATATFTCKKGDDTQVLTDNDIEVTTVSEETCTADRVETYTASVEFNGTTYTDKQENITVEGTATGHEEYDGPVWSWADDYSSATATFTCKKGDDTQVLTDNDIEVTTVSEETCTADRVETYTASVEFNGTTYTDTKENITVEGTATGHEAYDGPVWSWADDYSSATATFTCKKGDDTQVLTDNDIEVTTVSEETCTADRVETYTASVEFNGTTYTDTKENITVEGTATGHEEYDGPVWSWADDYSSATATFTCKKGDDTQVLTDNDIEVTTVSEETCTADRVETYTASVEFNGTTYTDKQENITVENTATGHSWGAWTDNGEENHIRTCEKGDATETQPHDFGEWTVSKPATETEEGEETRTCPVCGRVETRPIEKLAPAELTLTESINGTTGNRITAKVTYDRRGRMALKLTASEEGVKFESSKPKLLKVDEDGNVTFVRLCVFCKSATITATAEDGRTASCVVRIQLKWWQYIIFFLLGTFWF